MSTETDRLVEFLVAQRKAQAKLLPQFGAEKVLSVMATTVAPGAGAEVAVRRVAGIQPGDTGQEVAVDVAGGLPRAPERGECIAVSVACFDEFRGYQLKSHTLVDPAFHARLHRPVAQGARVFAPQVFTIHHGPQTANFFEKIPFDEVADVARRAAFALVAVGEQVNLSPRWILHHELRGGALELFQGDALYSKTYLNIRRNPRHVRIVLDPQTGEGYRLEGELVEFRREEHRAAAERIDAGWASTGLRPTRMYKMRVERIVTLDAPA